LGKSELSRKEASKNKTGIFLGTYAIHPLTCKKIPIYVADYVLMSYATGVVMGVPAHDERDHDFAIKYDLPIIDVIKEDKIINSPLINNLDTSSASKKIIEYLENNQLGYAHTTYKMKD